MAQGDNVSPHDMVSRPQLPATAHSPFPSQKLKVIWWGAWSFNFLDSCHVTHSLTEPSFHQPLLLAQSSPYTSQVALEEPACQHRRHKRCRFDPWVRKIPWRRTQQPTPVLLPGECHGRRSLEGYSPRGRKELDTTEVTEHTCAHTLYHSAMFIFLLRLLIALS